MRKGGRGEGGGVTLNDLQSTFGQHIADDAPMSAPTQHSHSTVTVTATATATGNVSTVGQHIADDVPMSVTTRRAPIEEARMWLGMWLGMWLVMSGTGR